MSDTPHWRWSVTFGTELRTVPGPSLVQRLVGVSVRCPNCGEQAGRLLRSRSLLLRRTTYLLHCGHCHKHPPVRNEVQAVRLVGEVAPDQLDRLFPAS